MKVSIYSAQKKLFIVWFVVAAIEFLFVILHTTALRDSNASKLIWEWFLPNIMPTLLLIIGVFVSDVRRSSIKDQYVDIFIYRAAIYLSIAYALLIMLSMYLSQTVESSMEIDFLRQSNLWLAPAQGLVSAILGIFLVVRNSDASQNPSKK